MSGFELKLMLAPMCECLVLVGIHSYLGIHVIRRGVIFIDLALAQIAALGTTLGFIFGLMPETKAAFIFSIFFTFVGAAIFALTRTKSERIPQEAVIGLVYAIASAISIIAISKGPHGGEHLKEILVGRIAWVRWEEVESAALAYLSIGVVHYFFRDKFLLITLNPQEAYDRGINIKLWDFLFYLTFGFVISFSVNVAGVLLVFIFLVVPAITAILITEKLIYQLAIGWAMGSVVTIIGIFLSRIVDLPVGPAVVTLYGLMLLPIGLFLYIWRSKDRGRALKQVVIGCIAVPVIATILWSIGFGLSKTSLAISEEMAENIDYHERAFAQERKEELELKKESEKQPDELLLQAKNLLKAGKKKEGFRLLLELLSNQNTPLFFKNQALFEIKNQAGTDFGYKANASEDENLEALKKITDYYLKLNE